METVVVDTDVLINHARGTSEILSRLLLKQEAKQIKLILPSIVIFEFYSGTSLNDSSALEAAELLMSQFSIQPLTLTIAKKAAELNRGLKLYRHIGTSDILIAATTIELNARLATGNRKHFALIPGLPVIT